MVAVCETGLEFTASTPGPRDSTASATDFEDAHCTPDTSITVVAAVPAMSIPPIGSNERLSWGAGRVQLTESTAAGTAGAGNPPAWRGRGSPTPPGIGATAGCWTPRTPTRTPSQRRRSTG